MSKIINIITPKQDIVAIYSDGNQGTFEVPVVAIALSDQGYIRFVVFDSEGYMDIEDSMSSNNLKGFRIKEEVDDN